MDLTALLSFLSSHVLELVTLVVSLIWLYLEYRASIWLWPVEYADLCASSLRSGSYLAVRRHAVPRQYGES